MAVLDRKVLSYAYFVISSPNCLLLIWGFADVVLPRTSEDVVDGKKEECEGDYCLVGHNMDLICVDSGACVYVLILLLH